MTEKVPQKRSPSPEKPTTASQWKKAQAGASLRVPSGNVALVKPIGMQFFLAKGLVPNSLLPIVLDALDKNKPPQMDVDVLKDQKKIQDILKMVDDVCLHAVLEPVLTSGLDDEGKSIPEGERDSELLYVDEVDLEDKMFIFQYVVGGTKDVETFRKQLNADLGALQSREDVGSTTE